MKKIIMLVFLIVAFFSLSIGVEKAEKLECEKWELQADQYPGFYYTEWQAEQCGIK